MLASMFTVLVLVGACAANPLVVKREEPKEVHCGTTADATYSDCLALINDEAIWNANFNTHNQCYFTNYPMANRILYPAFNTACHGNCCVYYTDHDGGPKDTVDPPRRDQTRLDAQTLLGCADTEKDKINVLGKWNWRAVCISSGKGCSDCFDDVDFA